MTRSERIEAAVWSLIRWFDGDGRVYSPPLSERIEEARSALAPDPLSCPKCNHDPAVHRAGRCRYCEGPCSGLASEEGAGRGHDDGGCAAAISEAAEAGLAAGFREGIEAAAKEATRTHRDVRTVGIAARIRALSPPSTPAPTPKVSEEEIRAALAQGVREAAANEHYRRWGNDDPKLVAPAPSPVEEVGVDMLDVPAPASSSPGGEGAR